MIRVVYRPSSTAWWPDFREFEDHERSTAERLAEVLAGIGAVDVAVVDVAGGAARSPETGLGAANKANREGAATQSKTNEGESE